MRILVVALLWFVCATDALAQSKQPTIVLNGGNGMGPEITRPVLEMGTRAVVAVVIQESGPGDRAVADWKQAQAAEVVPIKATEVEQARQVFDKATLIWFGGGFTTRMMDAIRNTFLPEYVRERWMKGTVVGGDSAGAMIFLASCS